MPRTAPNMPKKLKYKQPEDVDAIDLAAFDGKVKNRIAKVGVELEGGWDIVPAGVSLIGDGSVDISANHRGELPTPTGLDPVSIPSWMLKHYPHHVNKSCGLHVHMSFNYARHYMALMEPEYPKTMQEYLKRWATAEGFPANHHFWKRLALQNQFCGKGFYPDLQAAQRRKSYTHEGASRYTFINYPYGLHETVEVRGLPMMDTPEQGVRAVMRVIEITNAFLAAVAKPRRTRQDAPITSLVVLEQVTGPYHEISEERV